MTRIFKKQYLIVLTLNLLFLILFTFINFSYAQSTSKDAIAIRIVPNPNHYSAIVWYEKQGFKGSPQSLTVDGYSAIRDGRTVYVNAANVDTSGTMFTNIYLISFNQGAAFTTEDIFGHILSRWKFNTNLLNPNPIPVCMINNTINCMIDDDCPIGDYCTSDKARITRDTRRLADISNIHAKLEEYRSRGYFPKLEAGTYLKNVSVSVWPSWGNNLSPELAMALPVDPINKLGDCTGPGFNEITCWNETTKSLYNNSLPDLHFNSFAYVYYYDTSNETACVYARFETPASNISPEPACAQNGCLDADGDGYGRPASNKCPNPELDCDDSDSSILYGTADEIGLCNNATDDDCDGLIDCDDSDCPACAAAAIYCGDASCNGTEVCDDGSGNPNICLADCGTCSGSCSNNGVCTAGECLSCYGPGNDCRCGNGNIDCGEECDYGDLIDGDGCSSLCLWECTDDDGDLYIKESIDFNNCTGQCGGGVDCIGNNDCDDTATTGFPINSGASDICDGIENDCDGTTPDGSGETAPDLVPNVGVCAGYSQTCGGFLGWENIFTSIGGWEAAENLCSDTLDNDCDGTCDLAPDDCGLGSIPDPNCSGTCNDSSERDFTVIGETDCDQCDFQGDDDGNQTSPSFPTNDSDWISAGYGNMIDQCDPACGPGLSVVHWDIFEPGTELSCDGIDNNCNGQIDEGCDDDGDQYCDDSMTFVNNTSCLFSTPGMLDCLDSGSDNGIAANLINGGAVEPCGSPADWNCDGVRNVACPPGCIDNDGDGYGVAPDNVGCTFIGDDCEDDLAAGGNYIWPGNYERCDNLDNDCNGAVDIDEGCDDDGDQYCDETMEIYYFNFVNPLGGITVCPLTTDNSLLPGDSTSDDCEDDDLISGPNINPSQAEVCFDPIDNNCDGNIDEGCTNQCIFTFDFPCDFP